ncbi:tetratricopeptide repeat protein [Candidatus Phyllobacterium onerii]|uniref:tetratricopeptide repeat protein n=1 Tax=Candidatus Phyllobacterium onerii TaxID=3020828 RepID=UPI00232D2D6B|nr:tetratricopeptide repeat protein [Phyllobacterium sp. IY22]
MPSRWQSDAAPSHSSPSAEDVRIELERILDSPEFRSTPRRRKLLKYLIEELLAGRDKALKGYTIATVVFGRDDSFDPQTDPVVRLEARRLRHDLNSYYVSAGRDDHLRITIPKGQYAPVIEWSGEGGGIPAAALAAPAPVGGEKNSVAPAAPANGFSFRAIASASIIFVIVMSVGLVSVYRRQVQLNETEVRGPALTVLPFATYGLSKDQAVLGRGIADELLIGLSRFPDFRLYMPTATALQADDPIEVGSRLGLTYVLDGSIQSEPEADIVRISARLTDVETRRIIWMGKYDRSLSLGSLLAMQDEISASVATVLGQPYGIIRTDESRKITMESSPTMTSYQCVLQAYIYRRTLTADAYKPALACLEQAVAQDPSYAEAWAMLGWLQMDAGRFGWVSDGNIAGAYTRGLATASRAISLDQNNILALTALSSIHHYMGNFQDSERLQRRALALNPNDPDTAAQLGWRLAVRGRFDEGVPLLQQALKRTVNSPGWYFHLIAINQYLHGEYEAMLKTAQASTVDGSGMSWSFVAIAEGALGNQDAAREALAKTERISPLLAKQPVTVYRRHQATDTIVNALVAGLRQAGWKEPVEISTSP